MNVKIPVELIKLVGIKKFSGYDIAEDHLNWHKNIEVNLNHLSVSQIKSLEALCAPHAEIRGVKNVIWEIQIWLKSLKNVNQHTVKRLRHFDSLLYNYVKTLPNHWLFQKSTEATDTFVAHYVSKIEYVPEQRERDRYYPAYVRVETIYERFGKREEDCFNFHSDDVLRKNLDEILLKHDLFVATDELIAEYKIQIARYIDLIPKIGHQFTVHGTASDDVPGNDERNHTFSFSEDRRKNRVVIDTFLDTENQESNDRRKDVYFYARYWEKQTTTNDEDEDDSIEEPGDEPIVEIPIHPFLVTFDLFRHLRMAIHSNYLKEYVYDDKLADKLILPEEVKSLVTMLVEHKEGNFKDIVAGKGGGAIILLTGAPGVGKTLTAEVFAEADKKPLYSVQASQLGTNPEELEKNLMTVLQRASRWNAIMLLDEADVYVHERGNDLTQNAIVGVFLRVLEYHASVLFLTSNRPELVDDAIASRCVAKIEYSYPSIENQNKIWKVLSDSSNIKIKNKEYEKFSEKHPDVSGRDVKNLLKLAALISASTKKPIDFDMLEYVLKFKPTSKK